MAGSCQAQKNGTPSHLQHESLLFHHVSIHRFEQFSSLMANDRLRYLLTNQNPFLKDLCSAQVTLLADKESASMLETKLVSHVIMEANRRVVADAS